LAGVRSDKKTSPSLVVEALLLATEGFVGEQPAGVATGLKTQRYKIRYDKWTVPEEIVGGGRIAMNGYALTELNRRVNPPGREQRYTLALVGSVGIIGMGDVAREPGFTLIPTQIPCDMTDQCVLVETLELEDLKACKVRCQVAVSRTNINTIDVLQARERWQVITGA
jgi:hypothetical protein